MPRTKEPKPREPKFYEMDGALRAYSNRAIVVAGLSGAVALIAVTALFFVRMEPPTVIRVNAAGEAQVVSSYGSGTHHRLLPTVLAANNSGSAPDEYEKQAFVQQFLGHYLNYDPHTLAQNWADAMNMMTINLRRAALTTLEKDNTVGKLEEEQAISNFKFAHLERDKDDPFTYTAFGVRTVHRINNEHEVIDQLVEEYHIRLANLERSVDNPDGLLVAEYWAKQIQGEKRDAVLEGIPGSEGGQ